MSIGVFPIGSMPIAAGAEASGSSTGASICYLRANISHPIGVSKAWLRARITDRGASTAYLRAISAPPAGVSTGYLRAFMLRTGSSTAYLRAVSASASALTGSLTWRPVIMQGGVDISARLTGEIVVEANEGAARIAEYSLRPAAGAIAPASLVGAGVTIDFAAMDAGGNPMAQRRLFTGLLDRPELDVNTGALGMTAADDLQGAAAQMARAQIDALTPGAKWSPAVFGDGDNWKYLSARLQTLPGSVDRAPSGALRYTAWAAKTTADIALTEADIVDGSLSLKLPDRTTMRNRIIIKYDYRYPLYKLRVIHCGWSAETDLYRYLTWGIAVPTRDQVQQALSSSEWDVIGEITWTPVPAGPVEVYLGDGHYGFWVVTDSNLGAMTTIGDKTVLNLSAQYIVADQHVADKLTFGFVCRMQRRYVQSVTESYTITVEHPESIEAVGVIAGEDSASMEVDSSGVSAWEAWKPTQYPATAGWPVGAAAESPPPVLTITPTTKEISAEYMPDAATDRTASAAAIEALIAKAQVLIHAGHRGATVALSVALNPDLDVDKTISVSTSALTAKGKLRKVVHRMDMGSGRAVTDIEIAITSLSGVGLVYPSDTPSAPAAPPAPPIDEAAEFSASAFNYFGRNIHAASPFNADNMIGFSSNYGVRGHPDYSPEPVYPEQFSFRLPGIDAASRDNAVLPINATYRAGFTEDALTLTIN